MGEEEIAEVDTHRVGLAIRHFHPLGFSVRLKATYVDQAGEFGEVVPVPGEDRFWVIDTAFGYRLPKRYGLITLEVKNLFDEEFLFQDTDPKSPLILPERLVLLRLTLNF